MNTIGLSVFEEFGTFFDQMFLLASGISIRQFVTAMFTGSLTLKIKSIIIEGKWHTVLVPGTLLGVCIDLKCLRTKSLGGRGISVSRRWRMQVWALERVADKAFLIEKNTRFLE